MYSMGHLTLEWQIICNKNNVSFITYIFFKRTYTAVDIYNKRNSTIVYVESLFKVFKIKDTHFLSQARRQSIAIKQRIQLQWIIILPWASGGGCKRGSCPPLAFEKKSLIFKN